MKIAAFAKPGDSCSLFIIPPKYGLGSKRAD